MGQTPEELKAQIAGTRADMSATVDAISDRTNPSSIARRQAGRVGDRLGSVRDAVIGRVDDVTDRAGGNASSFAGHTSDMAGHVQGAAGQVRDSVAAAPQVAFQKSAGNPVAAGLIAFGAGLLVASIIPASDAERVAADKLTDQAQPLIDQAGQAAHEAAGHLQDAAQQAVSEVRDVATSGVGEVREQAAGAAGTVATEASSSSSQVAQAAQQARQG